MRIPILILAALAGTASAAPQAAPPDTGASKPVSLPGLSYEVLRAGRPEGLHPTRLDRVEIRYVGRLQDGSIFSTSANNGSGGSVFSVRTVIPGFSALVQLMRPGDRWRMTIPAYLAYGQLGRRHLPDDATLKRDVPADSILVFDTELIAILPGE